MKKLLSLLALIACSNPTEPKVELDAKLSVHCRIPRDCLFFTSESTPLKSITQFRLDYGDGDIAWTNETTIRHIYQENKQYIVRLTVVDKDGKVDETYLRLNI